MEDLEQATTDAGGNAPPLGLARQSLLQLVGIVEGSKILLQLMQILQQAIEGIALLRADQPQLGLQPLLPAAPSVEISGNRRFDRPFPPTLGFPVHPANGPADADGIDASGKQQLKRIGLGCHASDCPDCDVRGRLPRSPSPYQEFDRGLECLGLFAGKLEQQFGLHLCVPSTADETCEPPDGPVVPQEVARWPPTIRKPDRSPERFRDQPKLMDAHHGIADRIQRPAIGRQLSQPMVKPRLYGAARAQPEGADRAGQGHSRLSHLPPFACKV
jgi:hypothetical protein